MHLKSLFRPFFAFKVTISRHFAGYASVALETIWRHEPRDLIFLGPPMTLLCLSRYSSEYSSKDESGCDARTRRSGSVSDWRTSFPRTIFVVQRKSFILKLKLSTTYLFGCKNYCEFRRFFSPPKKPKNAGCFGKNAGMRETTKFAGFPARLRDG